MHSISTCLRMGIWMIPRRPAPNPPCCNAPPAESSSPARLSENTELSIPLRISVHDCPIEPSTLAKNLRPHINRQDLECEYPMAKSQPGRVHTSTALRKARYGITPHVDVRSMQFPVSGLPVLIGSIGPGSSRFYRRRRLYDQRYIVPPCLSASTLVELDVVAW
jgi:hypothetical protein